MERGEKCRAEPEVSGGQGTERKPEYSERRGTMKILHLISQYPSKTGSGVYLSRVYKYFKKKGYDQRVLCGMNADDIVETEFDRIDIIKFKGRDISFPVVGMSDVMPYESSLVSQLYGERLEEYLTVMKLKISQIAEDFQPDVIFTNHLYLMSSVAANLDLPCKIYGFCHGTCLRQLHKNPLHRDYVHESIAKLDGIFCLSNKQREEIDIEFQYGREKTYVIGGGYDREFFFDESENQKFSKPVPRLIYAGKFSRAKGLIYVLHAFERLLKRYRLKLVLAGRGTGEEYEEIMDFIPHIKDNVEFYDYMPMKKLGELFRMCDIFIMPSFYEGLSLVSIEAMACGLRLVTTELENLIDFVGEEIMSQDYVEVVPMPELYNIDQIRPEAVNVHINNMERALEAQIIKVLEGRTEGRVSDKVIKFGWDSIVDNIEATILKNQ